MPRAAAALLVLCLLTAAAMDEDRYFPAKDRISIRTVPDHVLGPTLPPGGILAEYHGPKGNYHLALLRLPNTEKAAFFLLDVKTAIANPKYLPNMGGFQGTKEGRPFYAFAKGPYLAAVIGLEPDAADPIARTFAARLPVNPTR